MDEKEENAADLTMQEVKGYHALMKLRVVREEPQICPCAVLKTPPNLSSAGWLYSRSLNCMCMVRNSD